MDRTMEQSQEWVSQKKDRIAALQGKAGKVSSVEELFWVNKDIYKEYAAYDADSASVYAERNIGIASSLGRQKDAIQWKLAQIGSLISTGRLDEAESQLRPINPQGFSDELKLMYFATKLSVNQSYAYYIEEMNTPGPDRSHYFNEALRYRDSTIVYAHSGSLEALNILAWQRFDQEKTDSIKVQLQRSLVNSSYNSTEEALAAYMLAQIFREAGNEQAMVHWLVMSCISYVKAGCRNYDSESFQDLSATLLNKGDVNRAFRYVNYCANNLSAFKNRSHMVRITHLQEIIGNEYLKNETRHSRIISLFLTVNTILATILILLLIYLRIQMLRLKSRTAELAQKTSELADGLKEKELLNGKISRRNERLNELNEEMTRVNSRLAESNAVKEGYIGYVFTLCSEFIDKLDEFKKDANRLLRVGKREELSEMLLSPQMVQDELKSFYQGFDRIFLELFPDFVEKLNALMQPGQEFRLREEGRLNTELRILALMRLGISDCNKVAEFLHCSVQSVYNCRRSVYARLSVDPKDFKESITALGHYSPGEDCAAPAPDA